MRLKDLKIKISYRKIKDDIAEDFYIPCMHASSRYDRISGYFGSTIYLIAWKSLKAFVNDNHGVIRIICSPFISEYDYDAIKRGEVAKSDTAISRMLFKEMETIFKKDILTKPERVLACLISNGNLEIKMAVGELPNRLYHDKVGVFYDNYGNAIGFRGTINETFKGLSNDGNFESLDVFTNWNEGNDRERLKDIIDDFDLLWRNKVDSVRVYDVPEGIKFHIREHYKKDSQHWLELIDEIETTIDKTFEWSADKRNGGKRPRAHQLEALEKWEANGKRGILEHATGSGKTFTAICAIRKELEQKKPVLVLVPSVGLLKQWYKELQETLNDMDVKYLLCGGHNISWKRRTILHTFTISNISNLRITIATMDIAYTKAFTSKVSWSEDLFVVADEVHRIGSESRRKFMDVAKCGHRLGLSATPRRYGDPIGTKVIIDFFGEILQPPYTLFDAINSGVLTKYFYHPIDVSLTVEEQSKWDAITQQIRMLYARMSSLEREKSMSDSRFKMLLLQRSKIMKDAANKVVLAQKIIANNYKDGQRWIVYCDNQKQLCKVVSALQAANISNVMQYYSEMPGDREKTLEFFDSVGGVIVSIRCLDEGIDIPSTSHALILASSKNPREFIQRRGRILRTHIGKYYASLYDAIVIPKNIGSGVVHDTIVESELSRAIQFGDWAENKECTDLLKMIALENGIDYKIIKEEGAEENDE